MVGGSRSGTAALREVPLLLAVLFLGTNLLAAVDMAVAGVPTFPFVAARFSVAGLLLLGPARLLGGAVHPVDWESTRWGFTLGVAVTTVSGPHSSAQGRFEKTCSRSGLRVARCPRL